MDDLKNLNGYWEIEKVTFPNGETKDYSVSTTIDYIELKGDREEEGKNTQGHQQQLLKSNI